MHDCGFVERLALWLKRRDYQSGQKQRSVECLGLTQQLLGFPKGINLLVAVVLITNAVSALTVRFDG